MKVRLSATEWMGIIRMKNNFGYLIREGFRGFRKHGLMSLTAICVTVACMIIIGGFALISYNLNCIVRDLESKNEIRVFIDDSYSTAEAKSIGTQLSKIDNINEREFITKEEAFDSFAKKFEDPHAFDGISAETFRDRFKIVLKDNEKLDETIDEIMSIEGVASVKAPFDVIDGFIAAERMLNVVSLAIIIVLFVVSLFVISNTVKLAMYDRKEEIGIMKMVGATNAFIRFPFVIEGTILGLISAAIAFVVEYFLYDLIFTKLSRAATETLVQFVPFKGPIVYITAAAFLIVGLLVGILGSLQSIRKFLDV